MIRLIDFSMGYEKNILLNHAECVFQKDCLTAVIGRNGSGKSTLFRALCGINKNYEGNIIIDDIDIKSIDSLTMASTVAFVNTKRPRVANMTCRDIVSLGRTPYTNWIGQLTKTDNEIIDYSLQCVGMVDFMTRNIDTLSDGECQRIMIAKAISQDTDIIILDEPTSFLDLPTRYEIVELLRTLAHEHSKTIIFSTHELELVLDMADNVALIDNRQIISASVSEMIENKYIEKMFTNSSENCKKIVLNRLLGKE